VEATTDTWNFWFGLLEAYVEQEGHARVPASFKTLDGYALGTWVSNQRSRGRLSSEQIAKLESVSGWTWDARGDKWNEGFRELEKYIGKHGHAKVPALYETADGYKLGVWVNSQRTKSSQLTVDKVSRLESLPHWIWNQIDSQWEEGYKHLTDFVEKNGHAGVAARSKTSDGYSLGTWVGTQRSKKDSLSPERLAKLEALPGWVWDKHIAQWQSGFSQLEVYVEQNGHARVARSFKSADGYSLGIWVGTQRSKKDSRSPEQRAQLESLPGWTWDMVTAVWEDGYGHLKEFVEQHGHAKVGQGFEAPDGFGLGLWVNNLRAQRKQNKLSDEKVARLESLAGWAWDVLEAQWEDGYGHLKEFVEQHGHAKVENGFEAPDGFRLRQWVAVQRTQKDKLSPERFTRLEVLPGWLWDIKGSQWDDGFVQLEAFAQKHGHSRVAHSYTTEDEYRLGHWVASQRRKKNKLSDEKTAKLESLAGWAWSALEAKWDEGFGNLAEFVEKHGQAKVTQSHITPDGYALGSWVSTQRMKKKKLSAERIARLEALPGWVWKA
jgi:hypothetical protein